MSAWKTLSRRIAYENPFMRVHEDSVINPADKQTVYGYCESTEGGAYIIPVDNEGYTYLVNQYRYPLKKNSWEIIAGRVPHDEDIAAGAKRERLEESSLEAGELIPLSIVYAAPGITNFSFNVFLARKLRSVSDGLDKADGINSLKRVPMREVEDMIVSGQITCSTTIAAFFLAKAFLEKEQHNV